MIRSPMEWMSVNWQFSAPLRERVKDPERLAPSSGNLNVER